MGEFVTKDSGARASFDSGMVRDTNDGKTLWHLVASGPMLRRWAELLTRGAVKYDADNWMKARGQEELNRFRESAFRHFMQWFLGDTDEDHAAAVMFNINGAEYVKGQIALVRSIADEEQYCMDCMYSTMSDDEYPCSKCFAECDKTGIKPFFARRVGA